MDVFNSLSSKFLHSSQTVSTQFSTFSTLIKTLFLILIMESLTDFWHCRPHSSRFLDSLHIVSDSFDIVYDGSGSIFRTSNIIFWHFRHSFSLVQVSFSIVHTACLAVHTLCFVVYTSWFCSLNITGLLLISCPNISFFWSKYFSIFKSSWPA